MTQGSEVLRRLEGSLSEVVVCSNAERGDFAAGVMKKAASLALMSEVRDGTDI